MIYRSILAGLLIVGGVVAYAADPTYPTLTGARPIVIGHRGACGYRPEHTLASYEVAIAGGADFIEPDLVPTKDGVLVARHENEIGETTDVSKHPEFAARKCTKTIDRKKVTGWFVEDFTLAEIKTLRAKERLPFRDHSFDGKFEIAAFQEVIDLAKRKTAETGRVIGIYPETKHPAYFKSIGLPLEDRLLKVLKDNGYDGREAPVFIQSFDVANLKELRGKTKIRLIQLMGGRRARPADFEASGDKRTFGDLASPAGLKEIATYADGIGPDKRLVVPAEPAVPGGKPKTEEGMKAGPPTSLVADAHRAGLLVHPYTFRSEKRYLLSDYDGEPAKEYRQFYELGVDGLFSDFADQAVKARR